MITESPRKPQHQYEHHSNGTNGSSSSLPTAKLRKNKHYILNKLLEILMSPYPYVLMLSASTIMLLTTASLSSSTPYYDDDLYNYFQSKSSLKKKCNNKKHNEKNHRKFISYTSSKWEKLWLSNINYWGKNKLICNALTHQKLYLQEFFNATCTARIKLKDGVTSDWCLQDDTFQPFWINVNTLDHQDHVPFEIEEYLLEKEKKEKKNENENESKKDENNNKERDKINDVDMMRRRLLPAMDDHYVINKYMEEINITDVTFEDYYVRNNYIIHKQLKIQKVKQTIENPKSQPYNIQNLPEDDDGAPLIFSKFIFLNEYTNETYVEYIEPLVSHLRHPLALCSGYADYDNNINDIANIEEEIYAYNDPFYLLKRSYIIPPLFYQQQQKQHHDHSNNSKIKKRKYYYFDAGASSWKEGAGGPSLDYFTKIWSRHNIDFDLIEAWEGDTTYDDFNYTIPEHFRNKTMFHNKYIVSSIEEHNSSNPFLPLVIQQKTNIDDYVLFKLDIDNGVVEIGIVNHLLNNDKSISCYNDHLDYIDEFVWEHHVDGNYLLKSHWADTASKDVSIYDSYQLFLKLRQRGVRAHSWV